MHFLSFPSISVQSLKNLYQPYGINVDVLRLDQIHPLVSGNKWFKLKEYVKQAQEQNKKHLLTFGGAYSNHIVATAAAAKELGLQAIGIIRGERSQQLSPTLQEAEALGMDLFFVSREIYKLKEIPPVVFQHYIGHDMMVVHEGGYGVAGSMGAASILDHCDQSIYSHVITAVGTGTTLSGLVRAANDSQKIIGISVLKNAFSLLEEINALLPPSLQSQYTLLHDYHFRGYAKTTPELIAFMNNWYLNTQIPLDFVYTGKTFFAADQLIKEGYFKKGSNVLLIHSGGLQGNRSLPKDTLIF
jgi:1-aminocyclopropane-1-carboxylate deaminase